VRRARLLRPKVLSKAGVASRRRAEEMIAAGRVIVNGQVVTQLGAKADPARDHIRVDGKLLQGAERHRYFVLNKPRGFVTTVSDPEGRPTVMQFFEKTRERVYPVGRLDYLSEGLLLMTNDGELANRLTRAASGVEKTYLVKVAGQPTEDELELLRRGVAIERGKPGSPKVQTSAARVRQIRQGDNPWYEVVLIEGRNRELRKMFSAIGHFVEKIRRVGYGPLVLDLEPGNLRELDPEELTALRLTAEGKFKPRKFKTAKMLPREAGRAVEERPAPLPAPSGKPFGRPDRRDEAAKPRRPESRFAPKREGHTFGRGARPGFGQRPGERPNVRPSFNRSSAGRGEERGEERGGGRLGSSTSSEHQFRGRTDSAREPRRESGYESRPRFDRRPPQGRPYRPDARPDSEQRSESQPPRNTFRPSGERPASSPSGAARKPFGKSEGKSLGRPAFGKPARSSFDKPAGKPWRKPAGETGSGPRRESPGRPQGGSDWQKRSDVPRGKPEDSAPSSRSYARPAAGGKRGTGPTGRPKPAFGAGRSRPSSGARPGGFSKSGSKGPGFKRSSGAGPKRTGPRPSGKWQGGGKKRG
jgi:23S rRNA pseudouridine2605 synthase